MMIFFYIQQGTESRARRVGFSTEPQALAYLRRFVGAAHVYEAAVDNHDKGSSYADIPQDWTLVWDLVHPLCEHGLSLDLCHGPQHYMSADQERAMDFQYADWQREAFAGMAD
jgi:hypothetical protein